MKSRFSSPILVLLALAILFSLPALACTVFSPSTKSQDNGDRETKMAADVQASLTANAETQAAQVTPTPEVTITPPPSPTLPVQPKATEIPGPTRTSAPTRTSVPAGPWAGEITFARDVTQDDQPIDPGTVFKKGIARIYGVFPFSGFEKGSKITLYWTVNGKEFVSYVFTWDYDHRGSFRPIRTIPTADN